MCEILWNNHQWWFLDCIIYKRLSCLSWHINWNASDRQWHFVTSVNDVFLNCTLFSRKSLEWMILNLFGCTSWTTLLEETDTHVERNIPFPYMMTHIPLTWVKKLRVFPFFLIMVQRPQIDDDSGSFLYCEVSNAAKKHRERERKAQWEAHNSTRQRWNDADDRDRPLQGIYLVSLRATWGMKRGATGRIRNTSLMVASR